MNCDFLSQKDGEFVDGVSVHHALSSRLRFTLPETA